MPYGQDGDSFFILDLIECNIPTVTKRDEHFPEKGITRGNPSTGKGKVFEKYHRITRHVEVKLGEL